MIRELNWEICGGQSDSSYGCPQSVSFHQCSMHFTHLPTTQHNWQRR